MTPKYQNKVQKDFAMQNELMNILHKAGVIEEADFGETWYKFRRKAVKKNPCSKEQRCTSQIWKEFKREACKKANSKPSQIAKF